MSKIIHSVASRVVEFDLSCGRLLVLPIRSTGFFSFAASIRTDPDFGAGEQLVQHVVAGMLDGGTRLRDKYSIADTLDRAGIERSYSGAGRRVVSSGRALSSAVETVFETVAEELMAPLLDRGEFEKARARLDAQLRQAEDNTSSTAAGTVRRLVFGHAQPNYRFSPPVLRTLLAELSIEDIRTYYSRHFSPKDMTVVVVGDVHPESVRKKIDRLFDSWSGTVPQPCFSTGHRHEAGSVSVHIADRMNLDVSMGHGLALRRQDRDFLPLHVGNHILGGNFSARLMQIVRDRLGLTYSIGSSLAGMSTEFDALWETRVSLSQESLDMGIDETRKVIVEFAENGPTAEEVARTKQTLIGTYLVGQSTTASVAWSLLVNANRGFDVAYLDRFPDLIRRVTEARVRQCTRRYLDPDRLVVAVAGSLPASHEALLPS